MSNFMHFTVIGALGGTVELPASRRPISVDHFMSFSRQALPTDPIGSTTVTLTNVVIDSRVVVRDQANTTTFYNALAASSTVVIVLQVYAAGSPLNLLRIDVRKASAAPFYQRYKTLMTAAVGAASVYINQLPDQR